MACAPINESILNISFNFELEDSALFRKSVEVVAEPLDDSVAAKPAALEMTEVGARCDIEEDETADCDVACFFVGLTDLEYGFALVVVVMVVVDVMGYAWLAAKVPAIRDSTSGVNGSADVAALAEEMRLRSER